MTVRWGVLGAGSVAQRRVMPAMNSHASCDLKALMVRDLGRSRMLAEEHGADRHYDSVEALLGDVGVDAIYVSSPVHLHCEHVLAAADKGKHVLCEKPMALSSAECRRMIEACEAAGVHLQICFVLRGWPIYHRVRELVVSGRLGRVVELRAHLAKWTPREEGDWRLDPKQSGGGSLVDVGSHYLDLFRYLEGDLSAIAYMGSSEVFGYAVEESAYAMVEFVSGSHGVLGTSYAIPYSGNILEIYGTQGTLLLGKELKILSADGEHTEPVAYPDYYSGLLENFCQCLEGGVTPMASGLDGLRNVEAMESAYLAGREQRIVSVPR